MVLRVRAEAGACTGKFSIPEIPVLWAFPTEKGRLSGEQAGTYPYFGSFPEQGRGQKEEIRLNPLGVGHHHLYFSSSSTRKSWPGNPQRRNGVGSWHLLSLGDLFIRVPSGQGHNLILAGVGPGNGCDSQMN